MKEEKKTGRRRKKAGRKEGKRKRRQKITVFYVCVCSFVVIFYSISTLPSFICIYIILAVFDHVTSTENTVTCVVIDSVKLFGIYIIYVVESAFGFSIFDERNIC